MCGQLDVQPAVAVEADRDGAGGGGPLLRGQCFGQILDGRANARGRPVDVAWVGEDARWRPVQKLSHVLNEVELVVGPDEVLAPLVARRHVDHSQRRLGVSLGVHGPAARPVQGSLGDDGVVGPRVALVVGPSPVGDGSVPSGESSLEQEARIASAASAAALVPDLSHGLSPSGSAPFFRTVRLSRHPAGFGPSPERYPLGISPLTPSDERSRVDAWVSRCSVRSRWTAGRMGSARGTAWSCRRWSWAAATP